MYRTHRLFTPATSRLYSTIISNRYLSLDSYQVPLLKNPGVTASLVKCQLLSDSVAEKEEAVNAMLEFIQQYPHHMVIKTIKTLHNPQAIMSLYCGHNSVSMVDGKGKIAFTMSKRPNRKAPLYAVPSFSDPRFPEFAEKEITVYEPLFTDAKFDIESWVDRALLVPGCALYLHLLPLSAGVQLESIKRRVDEILAYAYPYQLFSSQSPFDSSAAIPASNCNSAVFEVMTREQNPVIPSAYCQEAAYQTIIATGLVQEKEYLKIVEQSGLLVDARPSVIHKETYYASFSC